MIMDYLLRISAFIPAILGFACLFTGLVFTYFIYKVTPTLRRLWILLAVMIIASLAGYLSYIIQTFQTQFSHVNMSVSFVYLTGGIFVLFASYATLQTLKAIHPIHNRELKNKNAHYCAEHDYLTRLKNCPAFVDDLNVMIKNCKRSAPPCSLLYIDLDGFKQFNLDYGYACGDYLLTKVADIFKKRVRSTDIVARYGGDEFVIALYSCDVEQAEHFAKMLVMKLGDTEIIYKHNSFTISCSIGVSEISGEFRDAQVVISNAQRALERGLNMGNAQVNVADKATE